MKPQNKEAIFTYWQHTKEPLDTIAMIFKVHRSTIGYIIEDCHEELMEIRSEGIRMESKSIEVFRDVVSLNDEFYSNPYMDIDTIDFNEHIQNIK